jgi:hypothetical protein
MNDPSSESSQHVPRSLLVELEQAIAASHAQDSDWEDARIGGLEEVRDVAERLVGSAVLGTKGGTQVRRAQDEQFLAAGALTDAEFAELHPGERFVGSPPGYAVGGMVHSELKGCACAKCVSRWREGLAAPHSSAAAQTSNASGSEALAPPVPAQLAEAPVPGLYRHRKGRAYRVHGVAAESTNARSGRKVVVYEGDKGLFTRDLDEWNQLVDGEPRFRLVAPEPQDDAGPAVEVIRSGECAEAIVSERELELAEANNPKPCRHEMTGQTLAGRTICASPSCGRDVTCEAGGACPTCWNGVLGPEQMLYCPNPACNRSPNGSEFHSRADPSNGWGGTRIWVRQQRHTDLRSWSWLLQRTDPPTQKYDPAAEARADTHHAWSSPHGIPESDEPGASTGGAL